MAKKKILLIDYDQSALNSLEGVLTEKGYEVVTAGDGQAGWDKFNKETPDLVLMEAMLPKVHGFELCQRITSERNPQTTVFMMTGVYKDRVYRTEALRTYGAAEYFEKPLKMADLMTSIESVLGKPEPKPAAAAPAPAKPQRGIRPEPVPVETRKPEKSKPARDEFALPADLDMLSREMPKARKPTTAEMRLDSLADEILKPAAAGPSAHRAVPEKPKDQNGNGHKSADIDQFLKSALAGLDLSQEKVKVPKTAPLPPPPQAGAKQKPAPQPSVVDERTAERPKPAPQPQTAFSQPAPKAPTTTLAPGDPGSDASPFFTPERAKPARLRDIAPAPVPPRPVEKPKVQPPSTPPRKAEVQAEEKVPTTEMFTDLIEAKSKKGFSPIIAAGAVVAVMAVAGFLILRPKKPAAPVAAAVQPAQTAVEPSVPETKAEEPPATMTATAPAATPATTAAAEPKPKAPAPKPKVETQTRVAAVGPSSEDAILLPSQSATVPGRTVNPPAASADKPANAADSPVAAATQAETPPVKPEANPVQPAVAKTGTAAEVPSAAPVKEGDLVDLAAVDQQPRILKPIEPVYPPAAQRLGVEGSITVNALIDETGTVIDTGILKGIKDDRGLGKAAETAVKKCKFQPARKGGVNVKVWKSFVVVFKNPAKMIR